MGCVYCVTNKLNGKKYVGKTMRTMAERKAEHELASRTPKSTIVFHLALKKYGFDAFDWEIVFIGSTESTLFKIETLTIRDEKTKLPLGYNMSDGGEGNIGNVFSLESRLKLSAAKKGKIPRGAVGRILSPETKRKMSEAQKIAQKGKTLTPEHRMKIAQSLIGHQISEETRLKISLGNKGKIVSPESRKRIGDAQRGKKKK